MPITGQTIKPDNTDYQVPFLRSSGMTYTSIEWDMTEDEDFEGAGADAWTGITSYMVSANFTNNSTNNIKIEISLDGGSNWTIVYYDSGSPVNLLNQQRSYSGTDYQIKLRVTFEGEAKLDWKEENLETVEGRLINFPFYTRTGTDSTLLAFTSKAPVPSDSPGAEGKKLQFYDLLSGRLVAKSRTRERGVWRVTLPYGTYKVTCGRKTVMESLVVGVTNWMLQKRTSAVVNQEERAYILSRFGDLSWARFVLFDTFEDTSKASTASNYIRYSRLWAANSRYMDSVSVYLGVD